MKALTIKRIKDHFVPVSSGLGRQFLSRTSSSESNYSSYCRIATSHRSSRLFG